MPTKRKTGREAWVPLPRVSGQLIRDVEEFLRVKYDMKRPPEVASALLALIIELDRLKRPFPPRQQIAEWIRNAPPEKASPYGIDAALSVALARELIDMDFEVVDGKVKQRDSVKRLRYYRPTQDLLEGIKLPSDGRRVA